MEEQVIMDVRAVELGMQIAAGVISRPVDVSTPEALQAWTAQTESVIRSLELAVALLNRAR